MTPPRTERAPLIFGARPVIVVPVAIVLATAVAVATLTGRHPAAARRAGTTPTTVTRAAPSTTTTTVRRKPRRAPLRVIETSVGALPAPRQDASIGTTAPEQVVFAGGLDAASVSVGTTSAWRQSAAVTLGTLPQPAHDTAAAALDGSLFVFGGGTASGQLDTIVRVDGSTGASSVVGHLPTPSSDSAATVVGHTAYVVGGYTGTSWLDTIVAWQPGAPARVVAHLGAGRRYAAVAAVGGRIVIAGGSTPADAATDEVDVFDPATGGLRQIAPLPAPTTHAAAAPLHGRVVVIGGRGATLSSPTDAILAVDPVRGTVTRVGTLAAARSDVAAVAVGDAILLVGGRSTSGAVATVSKLLPATPALAVARPRNVYAQAGAGMLSATAAAALPRVYVPNSQSNTVDVIDPATFRVVGHFPVGELPQHVTPSYDMRTLYVDNDRGNSLTPIDPRTGAPSGPPIPVTDPYNLYFTPNGRYAIVVAERMQRLDFRDPRTMALIRSVPVPCIGVDHMDFTADGTRALASCEFSSQLVSIDVVHPGVVGSIALPHGAKPQDVKLSPDGSVFYVADMASGGLWEIDAARPSVIRFLATGRGAHGLYPSRDARFLYVSNRDAGTVSVVSFATRRVVATWDIPGGSPDMGGVSADGHTLWLSGRYNAEVYAIDTRTGHLLARIRVGLQPHGLSVWPQPGRFSLGHTGITR